ncbi:hypothetical protein GALL_456440 [mine drainage metagenome]|uniref:Uncharacterized protein n=1 Tax=mine drainage metagenome TaxID=410659 RepID=A0A1J5PMJ7_9ZZZZ
MLEKEVFVTPRLEARIVVIAKRRKRRLAGAVKVAGVVFEAVIRREIHTAAEPRHRRLAFGFGHEHAHIHMHRRHIGVGRVEHQRNAQRLKRRSRQFGPVLRGRRRQLGAAHMREVAAAALQQGAALDQAADALALQRRVGRAGPGVAPERGSVRRLERVENAGLKVEKVGADLLRLHDGQRRVATRLELSHSKGRNCFTIVGRLYRVRTQVTDAPTRRI